MHHDIAYPVQYIKGDAEAGGRNENNTVYHHPSLLPLPFAVWLPRQTRDRGSYTIARSPGTNHSNFSCISVSLNCPNTRYVYNGSNSYPSIDIPINYPNQLYEGFVSSKNHHVVDAYSVSLVAADTVKLDSRFNRWAWRACQQRWRRCDGCSDWIAAAISIRHKLSTV